MNTCRNCDKPMGSNGRDYCSNLCEDMDRHPAPRDDYMPRIPLVTASERLDHKKEGPS